MFQAIRYLLSRFSVDAPRFSDLSADDRAAIGSPRTYETLQRFAAAPAEPCMMGSDEGDTARHRACVRVENGQAYTYDENRRGDPEKGPASAMEYAIVYVEPYGSSTLSTLIALDSDEHAAHFRARAEAANRGVVYESPSTLAARKRIGES